MRTVEKKKGFTLIEIIISIALLVLLAAFSIFKYGEVQEKSKQKLDIASAATFAETVGLLMTDDDTIGKSIKEIQSNDAKILEYVQEPFEGKSRLYQGLFKAEIDKNGKITVTSSSGEKMYPKKDIGKKTTETNDHSKD